MTSPRRRPCPTCPWRSSTPQGGFPGGIVDLEGLHAAIHGSPFDRAMQCHCTPDGPEAEVCVGFALQVGFDSAPLRMAAFCEQYAPDQVEPDPADPLLSLRELVLKHGGRGCRR